MSGKFLQKHDGFPNELDSNHIQDLKLLSTLDDEVRDAQRVQRQGQEEDLKYALGMMINRVEELSTLLAQAYKVQTELETSLKLARSNLQLALANNEMLEDALKSNGTGGKDVGWRRVSGREASRRESIPEDTTMSLSRKGSLDALGPPPSSSFLSASLASNGSVSAPTSPANSASSPTPSYDSRFFRFRFGSGSTSRAVSPPLVKRDNVLHLTSASSPALVVSSPTRREVELEAELETEKAKSKIVYTEKLALEAEVENLSQALFEEANKMVAEERIKCANAEEELRQATEEKMALKSALRLLEMENFRLRGFDDDDDIDQDHTERTFGAASNSTEFPENHISPVFSPLVSELNSPRSSSESNGRPVILNHHGQSDDHVVSTVVEDASSLDFDLEKSPWAESTHDVSK